MSMYDEVLVLCPLPVGFEKYVGKVFQTHDLSNYFELYTINANDELTRPVLIGFVEDNIVEHYEPVLQKHLNGSFRLDYYDFIRDEFIDLVASIKDGIVTIVSAEKGKA